MFNKLIGTKTGEALVHAQTKSLSAAYGNRPDVKDVVLVITDGKAEDPKLVKDVSKQMRDSGIMVSNSVFFRVFEGYIHNLVR